jgi:hypothetical protein
MQLINKIDRLIQFANHRIDYLKKNDLKEFNYPLDDIWSIGYDKGYIASLYKYIDDLNNLKSIISDNELNINIDDDDV